MNRIKKSIISSIIVMAELLALTGCQTNQNQSEDFGSGMSVTNSGSADSLDSSVPAEDVSAGSSGEEQNFLVFSEKNYAKSPLTKWEKIAIMRIRCAAFA